MVQPVHTLNPHEKYSDLFILLMATFGVIASDEDTLSEVMILTFSQQKTSYKLNLNV